MMGPVRITVLASGSGGNATLVQAGGTRLLVDCGVGPQVIEERMRYVFGEAKTVDAIVATHPHGDHVGKLEVCARHYGVPVYVSQPTRRRLSLHGLRTRVYGRNARFQVGDLVVDPMPVPHDAPNVALVFEHRDHRAALVTDLGHVPRGLREHLEGCQAVLFESNHDPAMLAAGPYPEFLKQRIASKVGHLSNEEAARLLGQLGPQTQEIVLMHLSEKCNSPMIALARVRAALGGRRVKLRAAHQDHPIDVTVRSRRDRPTGPRGRRAVDQLALPFV
jgi:phosphoribosyl 1,2-cyclic phosphodiesterase